MAVGSEARLPDGSQVGLETLAVAALLAAVVSFGAAVLRMVTPQGSLAGPATIFSWVSPVIALLAATFVVLLASGSPWYGRLLDEDGMVENATALMLALAGVFFATAWRRMDAKPARYFVGLLSVLLFAAAMEEISWGRRGRCRSSRRSSSLRTATSARSTLTTSCSRRWRFEPNTWLELPFCCTASRLHGSCSTGPADAGAPRPLCRRPAAVPHPCDFHQRSLHGRRPDGQRGGNRGVSAQPVPVCIRSVPVASQARTAVSLQA